MMEKHTTEKVVLGNFQKMENVVLGKYRGMENVGLGNCHKLEKVGNHDEVRTPSH